MTPDAPWPRRFGAATEVYDWPAVALLTEEYVRHLRSSEAQVSREEATAVLGVLRAARRYTEIHAVADALLGHGVEDALVRRQLAQALVDRDNPAVALLVYRGILEDPATSEHERAEALGGMGRCHKQLFVLDRVAARRAAHLPLALTAYRRAWESDPSRFWHGINVVALLARASREGLEVPGVADPGAESRRIATEVLDVVSAPDDPGTWELATACEAGIALGDADLAIARATRLTAHPEVDAFGLGSLLRQLVEVWELDTGRVPGSVLVPLLRSAVLQREGGAVRVDPHDARPGRAGDIAQYESAAGQTLEKVLGRERFQGMNWWLTGLQRCRAVARIESRFSDAVGTGFLVAGRELAPELPELVLVTNGHVLPEDLAYGDAVAVFHGLRGDRDEEGGPEPRRAFEVRRVWWYQPSAPPGLDVTLLELDAYPDHVVPIPLAPGLPDLRAATRPRAYVIGHPSGLDTPQFSLQDNLLIDHDDRLVHYRSPTEPGSSGSPVFDGSWRLIAVHHAGGTDMPALHGAGGSYPANEGISVSAIRALLRLQPPRAEDVIPG